MPATAPACRPAPRPVPEAIRLRRKRPSPRPPTPKSPFTISLFERPYSLCPRSIRAQCSGAIKGSTTFLPCFKNVHPSGIFHGQREAIGWIAAATSPPMPLHTGAVAPGVWCGLLITCCAAGRRRDRYRRRVIDGHEVSIITDRTACGLPWSAPAISA